MLELAVAAKSSALVFWAEEEMQSNLQDVKKITKKNYLKLELNYSLENHLKRAEYWNSRQQEEKWSYFEKSVCILMREVILGENRHLSCTRAAAGGMSGTDLTLPLTFSCWTDKNYSHWQQLMRTSEWSQFHKRSLLELKVAFLLQNIVESLKRFPLLN